MMKPSTQQLSLALLCLVGVFVALQNTGALEGTEFGGGWLTGPLLSMADIGTGLFLLAFVVTLVGRRAGAAIGLASALLCLPLCLYFIAPVPFSHIFGFRHQFEAQPSADFHWDRWAIAGMLTQAVTVYICLRNLSSPVEGAQPRSAANQPSS